MVSELSLHTFTPLKLEVNQPHSDSGCLARLHASRQPRGFRAAPLLAFSGRRAEYHLWKSQRC